MPEVGHCEDREADLIRAIRAERSILSLRTEAIEQTYRQRTRELAASLLDEVRTERPTKRLSLEFIGLFQIELATLMAVRQASKSHSTSQSLVQ